MTVTCFLRLKGRISSCLELWPRYPSAWCLLCQRKHDRVKRKIARQMPLKVTW